MIYIKPKIHSKVCGKVNMHNNFTFKPNLHSKLHAQNYKLN